MEQSQQSPATKRCNWWHNINRYTLRQDLFAGLTGAVIVLPQGVAFAMLAGMPPEYGLYTAIVPVIIAALFGSSNHLISGPTTPISIVLFATISTFAAPGSADYISLILTLTFMVGIFQLLMGIARLGLLVNFISHSVIVGFTAGAAVLIITSQMQNLMALEISHDLSFFDTWREVLLQLPDADPTSLSIGAITLVCALLIRRLFPTWPSLFLAMIIATLYSIAVDAGGQGVKLVGELPSSLPPLSLPDFSLDTISRLASGALAIAMLGLLEAVSIARSIAALSHQPHDANREFIGQGLANIVGSFFSSFASSGSFTRSGINYRAGAQTPLAAVFSSILVVLVILFAAPLAAYLPIPAMAAVLLLVAYRLVEWRQIRVIFKANLVDAAVLSVTFAATLLIELTFAIYVGVILSLVLHLNRISHPTILSMIPKEHGDQRRFEITHNGDNCPQLKIIRIDGSLFFGSSNYIERALHDIDETNPEQTRVLIIGSGINFIDVAGAELLIREAQRRRKLGGDLYLCAIKEGVQEILQKGDYLNELGQENIFPTKEAAISAIYPQLDYQRCLSCDKRLFRECPKD